MNMNYMRSIDLVLVVARIAICFVVFTLLSTQMVLSKADEDTALNSAMKACIDWVRLGDLSALDDDWKSSQKFETFFDDGTLRYGSYSYNHKHVPIVFVAEDGHKEVLRLCFINPAPIDYRNYTREQIDRAYNEMRSSLEGWAANQVLKMTYRRVQVDRARESTESDRLVIKLRHCQKDIIADILLIELKNFEGNGRQWSIQHKSVEFEKNRHLCEKLVE